MDIAGFLYSQIGYDMGEPARAIIRGGSKDYLPDGAMFKVVKVSPPREGAYSFEGDADSVGAQLPTGSVRYWGSTWNAHWWEIDFTGIEEPGSYAIIVTAKEKEFLRSEPIEIARHLLWKKTVIPVALDQMEERQRVARNGIGWKDCGAEWREANSHAAMVIALCELVKDGYEWLAADSIHRIHRQIIHGLRYLSILQDATSRWNGPKGAITHEIPNHMVIIPGDSAKGAVGYALAARVLADTHPEEAADFLQRGAAAMDYLLLTAAPHSPAGFSHMAHGAKPEFAVPSEFMTRDLVMMLWGCVELYVAGLERYKRHAVRLAREVMDRQVPANRAEGDPHGDPELWGHFYTFASSDLTEKANCHHNFGHDTGGTFPHYIVALALMGRWWRDHPDAPLWRECLRRFLTGYLIPACSANPFYLLPVGYFAGAGLMSFCGPWHGINTTLGFGASLAAKLMTVADSDQRAILRQIIVGNLQWMGGLNAGITSRSFGGCHVWTDDVPSGVALPYSQICGIGRRWTGNWTGIVGTIPNGFNRNRQFRFDVPASKEADEPLYFTDEDWIPHAAGYISGLTALRSLNRFA